MGQLIEATCRNCEFSFAFKDAGGFQFCLVRCDGCGRSKTMGFEGIPENAGSYRNAEIVAERKAGECRCGGTYKLDAPA